VLASCPTGSLEASAQATEGIRSSAPLAWWGTRG